jgi:peroxiredoxin
MKKVLFSFCFLPLLSIAQDKGQTFKIAGKTKNLKYKVERVYIQYRSVDGWKTDSVDLKDGEYQFTGTIGEPVAARFRVKYAAGENTVNKREVATVFLQPGKIKLTSVDSFTNMRVKGSKAQGEFNKLTKLATPYEERIKPLIAKYQEYGKAKDRENQAKVEEEIDAISEERNDKVYGEYVKNNPSSPVAMYALELYAGYDIDADKIEPVFNSLSAEVKSYPSAIAFKEELEIAKKTGIGKMAMDFMQNDTLNNPVKLSSFRGRYVLVDFWASWCGPCRVENPNVVKAFNKYKDKNFHIIGVSLDRTGQKDRWLKAIHDDHLEWTHVSDLKFWDNEVAKQYGIKAIPQNLLIGPDGVIIAKNLKGEELDKKLDEAINGKKGF